MKAADVQNTKWIIKLQSSFSLPYVSEIRIYQSTLKQQFCLYTWQRQIMFQLYWIFIYTIKWWEIAVICNRFSLFSIIITDTVKTVLSYVVICLPRAFWPTEHLIGLLLNSRRTASRELWPLLSQFSSVPSISVHAPVLGDKPHSRATLLPPPAVSALQISPADNCKSQTCQQSPAWLPALTLHRTWPLQA